MGFGRIVDEVELLVPAAAVLAAFAATLLRLKLLL